MRRTVFSTLLASLTLLCAGCCTAFVDGVVSDFESGDAIQGALVSFEGDEAPQVQTNRKGYYRVEVACGERRARVTAPGYPAAWFTFKVEEDVVKDFRLKARVGSEPERRAEPEPEPRRAEPRRAEPEPRRAEPEPELSPDPEPEAPATGRECPSCERPVGKTATVCPGCGDTLTE